MSLLITPTERFSIPGRDARDDLFTILPDRSRLYVEKPLPGDEREHYYRADSGYSNGDVIVRPYPVLRHTPCGVFVRDPDYHTATHDGERFIHHQWNKRFAYPTVEEALDSFLKRRRRYLSLLEYRIEVATQEQELVETYLEQEHAKQV